jgi:EmrB/QacA subfamily drug resistance transporter
LCRRAASPSPDLATDKHQLEADRSLDSYSPTNRMWTLGRQPCDEGLFESEASVPCAKAQGRWILAATILASSMAFIDGTVVNVALPFLQTNLNATAVDLQWVIEAYSLFLSALLLIGGSLGDHYGRRRIFLIGTVIFAIASAGCGFAGTIHQLIAARAVQGLGAALLVPGSLAIISSSFAEEKRGGAIGTWSAFSAITTAIGPVMGGWLIEHFSWRAVFFINLPIAILVVLISVVHVRENPNRENTRIDWLGAGLAATGLGGLVYGLLESSRLGFRNHTVVTVLVAAVILISLFVIVESRVAQPMLPLKLFRYRTFAGANLLTFLLYAALGGTLFFLPLNLIQVHHYSATAAGAALLPFILLMFVLSRWSGGLITKYGARLPLIVGPFIAACGFALFAVPGVDGSSYWTTFFPAVVVLGLGMAISVAPLTTTVMNSVGQNRVGVASGVNNAVARTAGLIAIAVLGIVMLHVFNRAVDDQLAGKSIPSSASDSLNSQRNKLAAVQISRDWDPSTQELIREVVAASFVSGFRTIMVIGSVLGIAASITAAVLIQPKARVGPLKS